MGGTQSECRSGAEWSGTEAHTARSPAGLQVSPLAVAAGDLGLYQGRREAEEKLSTCHLHVQTLTSLSIIAH